MKSILGFTAPKEEENQTVIPELADAVKPVRCMVKVKFPYINKDLEYYSEGLSLKEGDVVFVSGKMAGEPGRVTKVTTKFCIHTKNYERVLSVLDLGLHGYFRRVRAQMVSFGEIPLTPERFESWIKPPADPKASVEEDQVIRGEGYTLDIHNVGACEDLLQRIWERGVNYYLDGNLKYLCVRDGVGVAFVKGESWYRVDFRLDEDGLMTDVCCDCPYMGLCKHETAVALALRVIWEDNNYLPASDFVALDQDTFWQLAAMKEEIEL